MSPSLSSCVRHSKRPGWPRLELGVAQLGLSETDAHRLKTMLGIAATSSGLGHRWVMSNPSAADLVVLSPESAVSAELLDIKRSARRQVFAVVAGETDVVPPECHRLPWPVRLEHVVSLLEVVERKVEKANRLSTVPGTAHCEPDNDLVGLASILRGVTGGEPGGWRVDGIAGHALHISLADRVFYFDDSLANLRGLAPDIRFEFNPVPAGSMRAMPAKRPLIMLQWLIGLETGTRGLLPWIDTQRALQLNRYPPFPQLLHSPAHRRVAAALARPCPSVDTLTTLTGEDSVTIAGVINALNLCGYLNSVGAPPPQRSVDGAKRTLFESFRRALGIISGNA
jgi:hypothetical protein